MKEIIKYEDLELDKVNDQVAFYNNLLSEYDICNELQNINLIKQATKLAIESRKYLDPYYDINELTSTSFDIEVQKVYNRIINKDFNSKKLYDVSIPKNNFVSRSFSYYDITSYSIRFVFAIILYRRFALKGKVFGGYNDIFEKYTSCTDVYLKHNNLFSEWQKEQLKHPVDIPVILCHLNRPCCAT